MMRRDDLEDFVYFDFDTDALFNDNSYIDDIQWKLKRLDKKVLIRLQFLIADILDSEER